MTVVDRTVAPPRGARLVRVETGVRRLAGADEVPVILLPDLAGEVAEAVAPLLARRREVFVFAGEGADFSLPDWLGRVCVVGGASASGFHGRPRVAAAVVVRPDGIESGGVVALSGHPVEAAHLVETLLRDPLRWPVGARVERARP